jgi:hypothetical protein
MLGSIGPRLLITANLCPRCRKPVLAVDRGEQVPAVMARAGILWLVELADLVDLSAVPEKVDVTPHACASATGIGIVSQAVADSTTPDRPSADVSDAWEVPS